MIASTTQCHLFGHPEFRLLVDETIVLEEDFVWLKEYLERSVADGSKYRHHETVQIGWMINLVEDRGDGSLGLSEPDMMQFPIRWVDRVSSTLGHLRIQRDTVDSIGLLGRIDFPSIRQSAIVGCDLRTDSSSLVMERAQPQHTDSGWFIGRLDTQCDYNDPKNLRRVSLYEAALLSPRAVMFLALPSGMRIHLSETRSEFLFNGHALIPKSGTVLDCRTS